MLEKTAYVVLILTALVLAYSRLVPPGQAADSESGPDLGPAVRAGDDAPDFALRTPGGEETRALQAGRNTLLVYFSTSCSHCRSSLPTYRAIARAYCQIGLSFIVVDLDGPELGEWWSTHAWEPDDVCAEVRVGSAVDLPDGYGFRGTPAHVWVDPAGTVRHAGVGAILEVPDWIR